jgi:hypothetical protein
MTFLVFVCAQYQNTQRNLMAYEPLQPPSHFDRATNLARSHRAGRSLTLDYALGAAILGLNPFPNLLTVTLICACGLVLVMIRHIGKKWEFVQGQNGFAIAGNLFGGLGALAMAFMAWLTLTAIGFFVPIVDRFAISAALFTLTWMMGLATNQYYEMGFYNRRMD